MEEDKGNQGVPASPSGLRPFGVEPAAPSQAEPLVPNAKRSLLGRAPSDLDIHWHGAMGEHWTIAVACTIATEDELRAVIEILTILGTASAPASGIEAAAADETALAGSAEGESPVAKPDAQNPPPANP